jgi:hypothetical protein
MDNLGKEMERGMWILCGLSLAFGISLGLLIGALMRWMRSS